MKNLIDVWKDTEIICDTEFGDPTSKSTEAQVVYIEDIELNEAYPTYDTTVVKVTHNDTITAGYNAPGKVVIHNFASATNPGGGVTSGSSAQEECICRCTNLMLCLYDSDYVWEDFYQFHRKQQDNRYTNRCVFTPDVLIIKDKDYNRITPKTINVITCSAPNLREFPKNRFNDGASSERAVVSDDELYNIHIQRAKQIIKCAIVNKCDSIILGAFGCGAFRNNPKIVATAYNDVVKEYKKYFKYIEFAVYCGTDTTNFEMFDQIIER